MKLDSIDIGGVLVSRLAAGSNPISGFSHASSGRTQAMLDYFTCENTKRFFRACEDAGVNTVVARIDNFIMRTLREYWSEGGRIQWMAQTAPEHRDPLQNIAQAARAGACAVFVHGGAVGRLFAAKKSAEVRAQLEHIRGLGLPAGMAAHRPEYLLEAQEGGFPVNFFNVCLYNVDGYQGNQGEEPRELFDDADRAHALATMRRLERPCFAYKVLAAGRKSPAEGLRDVAPALRRSDGVILGMFPPDAQDIVGANVDLFARMAGSRER